MSQREVRREDRVVFVQVVEGLLRHGVGERVSPRLRERLRQAGVDLDRPLLPAYPAEQWKKCLHIIVEEVYPSLPPEEAFRQLAERHVEGYGRTRVGRAMFRLMRLLGPERTLKQMTQLLRTADNHSEVRLKQLGPGDWVLWQNWIAEAPGYMEMIFVRMLELSGATEPRVTEVVRTEEDTTFRITWKEP